MAAAYPVFGIEDTDRQKLQKSDFSSVPDCADRGSPLARPLAWNGQSRETWRSELLNSVSQTHRFNCQ